MSDFEQAQPAPRSLRSLNAVESVRQHPAWFFRSGTFEATELVSLLVEEAARGGARSVRFERDDGWIGVSADVDWLEGDVSAFFAPISYSEGGRNSARAEVAVTAFCDAVVTGENETDVLEIKSYLGLNWEEHGFPLRESIASSRGRFIVFLLPADARGPLGEDPVDIQQQSAPYGRRVLRGDAAIERAVTSFVRKMQDA